MKPVIPDESAPPGAVPPPEQVTALVLAAGAGVRLGLGPKAFLCLAPRETLLERAVLAVAPYASQIVVGVPPDDEARARALLDGLAHGRACVVCAGGATLLERATRPLVLLHEVARPFVPAELFGHVLAAAAADGAASLYLPIETRDSVALIDADGRLGAPLSRGKVVTLQTPHAYRRDLLLDAQRQAIAKGWSEEGTAAVVQRAGHPVKLVPGSPANVKLTYPADLTNTAAEAAAATANEARAGG
jgi:2-C-methyl-D-erythritol 4-phosphate cytidylyltransferase